MPSRRSALPRVARTASSLLLAALASAAAAAAPLDPLSARVDTDAAARFVQVFEAAHGRPSARQLQDGYLAPGGIGVQVFTPDRIVDAEHLAQAVAADPDKYRHAIALCLPQARRADADLRAIYLAYAGLWPRLRLPPVVALFGAGNSAGSADAHGQVIGLEAACVGIEQPEAFRARLRHLFAHETLHTLQPPLGDDDPARRDLLVWALREGAANFVAALVTGGDPGGSDNTWAMPQEAALWRQFRADRQTLLAHWPAHADPDAQGQQAALRWFWNNGSAPPGWPSELGYWIGQRVLLAYYQRQPDKRAALEALLELRDPDAILRDSGYDGKVPAPGE
ncbi:hypothetical protein [Xanthomonas theicola]|nr:hypothetical protein [Xanthomonas theicola]QNH25324.1 hypothetical protein G4Q83_12020 [Xanthomonas theicola]